MTPIVARYARSKGRAPSTPWAGTLLLLACGGPEVTPPVDPPVDTPVEVVPDPVETDVPVTPGPELPTYTSLDPLRLLVRASLDLRGVRPSLDEIAQVDADPAALDGLIERFLYNPRFGRRVREVFDEVFLMRDEEPFVSLSELPTHWSEPAIWEAIGEEPTRMLERIANEDLPYTAFVTGDWTMVNEVTGSIFPTDYPPDATGWRVAHYTDNRPTAGVLVSSGLWWQHGSMLNNLNRGRANQLSRTLMCFDYLESEIDFTGVSALDSEEAMGNAIRTNPDCAACHDSLDPLASLLYGFWYPSTAKHDYFDIRGYHPERERLWVDLGGLPPSFHGRPVQNLTELGQQIAEDPGFARCFVQRSWEGLLRRKLTPAEAPLVAATLTSFQSGGLHIRDAWRAIVRSDTFRSGTGDLAPKVVTPAILASSVEELTGFHWTEEGWDLIRAPIEGYAALAGGIDGISRSTGIIEPTPTLVIVQRQLAAMAASWVAERDLRPPPQRPGGARLLTRVDGTETLPEDDALLRAQLVELHLRIAADRVAPDAPRLDDEMALWSDLMASSGDPVVAWTGVLTVLLRDPNIITY